MDHCVFAGGARSATNEQTDQARRTMLLLWTTDQWGPVVRGCARSEIASREYPFASQQKLEMGVKLIASSAIHNESAEPQFILGPRAHTSAHDKSSRESCRYRGAALSLNCWVFTCMDCGALEESQVERNGRRLPFADSHTTTITVRDKIPVIVPPVFELLRAEL